MKFITEEDLRYQYKCEPFTTYMPAAETRLTPGARQFLNDRKVIMREEHSAKEPAKPDLRQKLILGKLKTVEAELLAASAELLCRDIILAQKVIELTKQVGQIKEIFLGKESGPDLSLKECTGIHEENFHCEMCDCFEITEFHIQVEKGKEIACLHRLRCILRETDVSIGERYLDTGNEEDCQRYHLVNKKFNQMVNTISQLICTCFGGKTCQKKM